MKKHVAWMSLVALFVGGSLAVSAAPAEAVAHVAIETSKGTIELELNRAKAPRSVENFLAYAKSGFYNGTIFHRVIPGFMIQGGGFTGQMAEKKTQPPVQNEADNGLPNARGTLAMARTGDPHSATAQFFINLVDNSALDFQEKSATGWGYAVFGKVTKGMDIVDAIAAVETTQLGPMGDVPVTPIEIKKVEVKD